MKLDDSRTFLSSDWVKDLAVAVPKGSRVTVVCSRGSVQRGTLDKIRNALTGSQIAVEVFAPETPDLAFLHEIFDPVTGLSAAHIVAVGGGSALDTAKAIKLFFSVNDWPTFVRQAEHGVDCEPNGCQIIAIPTTSGSGSEVTPFATLWDREASQKLSIDAPWLLPNVPIVDPSLLSTLSGDRLLYPALDAISHAVESLWSKRKTDESRDYALRALVSSEIAIQSFLNGTPDLESFALASTNAGRAIAISRTALAHSISYPLTLAFGVPHGLACSFSLEEIFYFVNSTDSLTVCETRAVSSVITKIKPLNLHNRMQTYCNTHEATALVQEMLNSGRANNLIANISNDQLLGIVTDSLVSN
jgi:alcohol dehydrogenase